MSDVVATHAERTAGRFADPLFAATAIAGLTQLGGLAAVSLDRGLAAPAVAGVLAGLVMSAFVLAPGALAAARRHPVAAGAVGLSVLAVPAAVVALYGMGLSPSRLWWFVRGAGLLRAVLITGATLGGLVLIADAVRVRGTDRTPWHALTRTAHATEPPSAFPWRALAGVLLVCWAGFLLLSLVWRYLAGDPVLAFGLLVVAGAIAVVVIGTPLLVGAMARGDRDHVARAVDDERQRVAAHLHDSVLQSLALIQRQAGDPAAVARLARRQEHALRAWMAGDAEPSAATLAGALRDVASEVEDEHATTVEVSVIGDRTVDEPGQALAAATREALRNAARHGGGASIHLFAELAPGGASVFVRDDGAGFDPATVAPARRGIRDAIEGRMEAVGGTASIESAAGEGTEVTLRIAGRR